MPLLPPSPRTSGGITGTAKANVNKIYRQMEELKNSAAFPAQKMPYNPNSAPSPAQKMPYTPPKDGSGPGVETMPFKPESPKKKPADRMKPTKPGKPASKKNRSAFEDNRMQ